MKWPTHNQKILTSGGVFKEKKGEQKISIYSKKAKTKIRRPECCCCTTGLEKTKLCVWEEGGW